jgi:hypothetical protein
MKTRRRVFVILAVVVVVVVVVVFVPVVLELERIDVEHVCWSTTEAGG